MSCNWLKRTELRFAWDREHAAVASKQRHIDRLWHKQTQLVCANRSMQNLCPRGIIIPDKCKAGILTPYLRISIPCLIAWQKKRCHDRHGPWASPTTYPWEVSARQGKPIIVFVIVAFDTESEGAACMPCLLLSRVGSFYMRQCNHSCSPCPECIYDAGSSACLAVSMRQ